MEVNKPVSSIIIFVVSLIVIFLFAWPKYQESQALQSKLDQKIAEYNSKSIYYEKIAQTLRDLEGKGEEVEKINSALPSSLSFAPLVYFLQKKGAENGLIYKSIVFSQNSASTLTKTAPSSSKKEIKNINFTLTVFGSYEALKNFLVSLEKSSRIFEVNTISFASPSSSSDETLPSNLPRTYDFKLEIVTHTY